MKNVLLQAAMKLNTVRKKRKWWQVAVRVMAIAVVFCTTYALILPAITMVGTPECGMDAHEHVDKCYTLQTVTEFHCDLEGHSTVGHSHGILCYNAAGDQICLLPEIPGHTHENSCYSMEEPAAAEQVLSCTLTETAGHAHESDCYSAEETLICELEEVEAHTHTDACYSIVEPLPPQEILTCGMLETIEHIHTESCLVETEKLVLTCEIPAHSHTELCYPQDAEEEERDYLCGSGVHTHVEHCYTAEGILACTIPEHTHEAACLVAELDMTADVETTLVWEEELSKLTLTGNWPMDVLTIAESQLGYKESAKNVVLEQDQLNGYTRYGEWYGLPYNDWCAMYASFCLHYAGVEEFPLESEVNRWIEALTEQERYYTFNEYAGKPGDLIFFDFDQKKDAEKEIPVHADHVGFVVEYISATDTEPAKIKTIEGNADNQVTYMTYELDDPAIIGFGVVPMGKTFILNYHGEDYTVTVSYTAETGIPGSAQLAVREILPGTEEYNTYYQQSVDAMLAESGTATEAELDVSFARFFDISFLVNGEKVEPTAAVDIKIQYADSFKIEDGNAGLVVHFAEDGTEVLDADTNDNEANEADTFEFTQDSFSVSGTLVATRAAAANTATRIYPSKIETSGTKLYVLYTQIGNRYYALDGNGYAVPITVSNNTVTLDGNATNDLFWSINSGYVIGNLGTSRYLHPYNNGGTNTGTTTANPYDTSLDIISNGYTFRIRGASNNYLYFANASSVSRATTSSSQANIFYIAEVGRFYNVWFDGTNGGMMSYYGAADTNLPVIAGNNNSATVTLPETWQSSTKYDYTLQGWYDVYNHKYYAVNPDDDITPTATITGSTVFYADWIAATYDVGQDNDHVVDSLDTNNFITTHVFDYNVLFNVLSQTHTGTISAAGHKENWSIVNNGTVPYNNGASLGFAFIDYDDNGEFSYPLNRDNSRGDDINTNQGDKITSGILQDVRNRTGQDLMDLLFNPGTDVIGKYYAGEGNYLFQYMDSTTENYDGIHDGYYYLDARLNAASYNQTLQRFYLYNYLERTSDSDKDGGVGQYSDFLPFNSPYLFDADQLNEYADSILRPGYEYDAKDGGNNYPEYNSLDDANTNYFFGIRSDIEFFLPNNTNTQDEYGNYGNISTRGEHMIFDFHGDDDVWVFVDGQLLLDIGGLHGVMFGQIDFSTGKVLVGKDGGTIEERNFNMSEGTHTMTVYYMERGSSQSNCAIYFNIAPRYDLEITKEDIATANKLDGAVFSIFNDEAMASAAQLWASEAAYNEDMKDGIADHATNTFTVVNGVAKCWGISAGKTYYIYETTPPPGYPESDDMIRITLNNRGTATIEATTLHGNNDIATEGFAVIKQEVNDTLKIVALTVTNQKDGDTTEVRIEKTWAAGSTNLPASITVYVTADGVPLGRTAQLTEANGWSYTWKGLPKYAEEGVDREIVYEVQEVLVPDYLTTQGESIKVESYVDWVRVAQMSDSKTYLLVHNGQALTYNGRSFGWMDPETAKNDASTTAQWEVTTDHDGFHLKNCAGYTLTFNPDNDTFYGVNSDAVALNQVIYYLNSRLVVHDHDVYYQFGTGGAAVNEDGLAFQLYEKEVFTGLLSGITNVPVEEDQQTYVEVTKVWSDGNEKHADDSVIIRLYAGETDTGRSITLNAANNWSGGFYDLPYYQSDGTTVIQYTVVEDPVLNYMPKYSDGTVLPGLPTTIWQNAASLQAGQTYSILSGSYALAMKDGDVASVPRDLTDLNQQWEVVNVSGSIRLRNLGTKTYLGRSSDDLYSASQSSSASITLSAGKICFETGYLELGAGYVSATTNSANATIVAISQLVETTGRPGTGYTVTNRPAMHELPHTGGTGYSLFTLGGLLMILAAACGYVIYTGRKRQRGGSRG